MNSMSIKFPCLSLPIPLSAGSTRAWLGVVNSCCMSLASILGCFSDEGLSSIRVECKGSTWIRVADFSSIRSCSALRQISLTRYLLGIPMESFSDPGAIPRAASFKSSSTGGSPFHKGSLASHSEVVIVADGRTPSFCSTRLVGRGHCCSISIGLSGSSICEKCSFGEGAVLITSQLICGTSPVSLRCSRVKRVPRRMGGCRFCDCRFGNPVVSARAVSPALFKRPCDVRYPRKGDFRPI